VIIDRRSKHLWDTVIYNETGQKLDIWMPASPDNAPVFFFIPGGGWMWGDRRFQGYELMHHLVERGWICVSMGYRTGPRRWPDQFEDVLAAWNWCDIHLRDYGASEFMAVGGASAGGHMASLLGLLKTSNRPDAVVSLYGVYDWTSRSLDHTVLDTFVKRLVVGEPRGSGTYQHSSPIRQVHADAPPFMVVHGTADILTPVSGARRFVRKLSDVSPAGVRYHEIPGAIHAFDLFPTKQTAAAVAAVSSFLSDADGMRLIDAA
jgi:acetyl esterase/lipase